MKKEYKYLLIGAFIIYLLSIVLVIGLLFKQTSVNENVSTKTTISEIYENNNLTIVETFVGAGGAHLGFQKAGFKSLLVNDIDKDTIDTLLKNKVINDKEYLLCPIEDITEEVIKHLSTNIKTKIGVSSIDGVGVIAIRDIKQYEEVFPIWNYESGIYLIPNDRLNDIPKEVVELLDKYQFQLHFLE